MQEKARISAHHNLRHWHHVYKKKRRRAQYASVKQMSFAQLIALLGAIAAGLVLDSNKIALTTMVGAFVVLPGIFDLTSSVGASLSAKINHRIDDGQTKIFRLLTSSLLFALLIGSIAGLIVSLVGAGIATILFDANFYKVLMLSEGSILLCQIIGFPIVAVLSIVLKKLKINPDDVVGPIETALFYTFAVISISVFARLLV